MFTFIRKFFRGERVSHPRPTSIEVKSKCKPGELGMRVALSIDSKRKEQERVQAAKVMELEGCEVFNEMDEVATNKERGEAKFKKIKEVNLDLVSDLSGDKEEEYELLTAIADCADTESKQTGMKPVSEFGVGYKTMDEMPTAGKRLVPRMRKELRVVGRERSVRKARKIRLQCPFCFGFIQQRDSSLQLACAHRFHEKCAVKMRERNRYECDLCEIRKRNQGSIILLDRQKSRCFGRGSE